MRTGFILSFVCAALLGIAVSPGQAQAARGTGPGPGPGAWWNSEKFKQELKLTDEQSARIEQIFQASLPQLQSSKDALDREQAGLSKLMAGPDVAEAEVVLSIDRVETARYTMSKARTMMLFRMNRVLTPDQRAKLEEIHRRDEAGRGHPR
jgi:Spy/CpxP family protein refolding chaperone